MKKRYLFIGLVTLTLILSLAVGRQTTNASAVPDDGRPSDAQPAIISPRIVQTASPSAPIEAPLDVIQGDDYIVSGGLCVGAQCLTNNTEDFTNSTIKLKEPVLRILFDDAGSAASTPANDWQITINDSNAGGANYFSIDDTTAGSRPFQIMAGASSGNLFVASNGNIGMRTTAPGLDLHIKHNDTPAIRLEQDNTSGWSPQIWDVAGNEANFFVRDLTDGSKLPFRIAPKAPTSSLTIQQSGNVGVGTWSPSEKLHVVGNILTEGYLKELSDENAKTAFASVSSAEVLQKVADLTVSTWSYKDEAGVRHMGPVAQEFFQAFGLGTDDRHLAALDVNGVALVSIQALNAEVKNKEAAVLTLESKVADLEARLSAMESQPGSGLVNSWGPVLLGLLGLGVGIVVSRHKAV